MPERSVRLEDLTGAQVARIEQITGCPFDRWQEQAPRALLFAAVRSVIFEDGTVDELLALPITELVRGVEFTSDTAPEAPSGSSSPGSPAPADGP